MRVSVIGFSPLESAQLTKAANFYGVLLFHDKDIRDTVHIIIQYDPDLQLEGCAFPDDEDILQSVHRVFRVSLVARPDDYDGHSDPIRTLAHEMTHCKQWALDEYSNLTPHFKICDDGEVEIGPIIELWLGNPWAPQADEDSCYDSPWEIEAYGRETTLYARWRAFNLLTKDNNDNNTTNGGDTSRLDTRPID